MRVVDLSPDEPERVDQAARILHEAFLDRSPAWPTIESARAEVDESFVEGRISRVALDGAGSVIGWIGGIPLYDGHVLEVHPLAVAAEWQGRGVGRQLIQDLEALAAAAGTTTLFVGTDDETGDTNVSGRDLYPDVPGALRDLASVRHIAGGAADRPPGHPFEFYRRAGFTVVGLLPDANGPGKPDILMAKRVGPSQGDSGPTGSATSGAD